MSDPSAIQIPVNQALTSDMLLGLKPSAPKSRTYRVNVAPLNKNMFYPGDQMIFELPTGRKGSWLDTSMSYVKFSVQFAATAAIAQPGGSGIYLDNSAYSFFQRLDVYNGSNLLESINEYGQLANFLLDTSLSFSDKASLSPLIGTNAFTLNMNTVAPVLWSFPRSIQTPGDRSGMSFIAPAIVGGAIPTAAFPYCFCLPVMSAVVGSMASKMLPVGQINNPIRLEFYMAPTAGDAIYFGAAGAGAIWQLVNVEFVATYVEIQDDNLDMRPAPGEAQYISTRTYRHTSIQLPTATNGEFTAMLPFRCASLTAMYARFRNYPAAVQGVDASAAYRKSSSINPNISSYYFRIASSMYPNKPVYLTNGTICGSGGEGYAELLKSFHALSSSIGNAAILHQHYNVAQTALQGFNLAYTPQNKIQPTDSDTFANNFAIGLELESFSNRSDTILSGISTLNSQVFFTANLSAAAGFNYTCDFFGQMDMILVLMDGMLTAKF